LSCLKIIWIKNRIQNILRFNSALAFVSFGMQCFPLLPGRGAGPPVVTCHGQVYHLAGRLFPEDDNARYAQLYMYDHGEALGRRALQYPDLGEQTLDLLQKMLEDISPYAAKYQHMGRVAQAQGAPEVKLGFLGATGSDVGRYSAPTTMEPGVIFVGAEGVPETNRDIVIWPHE
jgi:hypothetical protein